MQGTRWISPSSNSFHHFGHWGHVKFNEALKNLDHLTHRWPIDFLILNALASNLANSFNLLKDEITV